MGLRIALTPGCPRRNMIHLEKVPPPVYKKRLFFPGLAFDDAEDSVPTRRRNGRAYGGMAMTGPIGVTICEMYLDSTLDHRGLHVRGAVISHKRPAHLDEVVVFHAMRTLHDWLRLTGQDQEELYSMK